jgi:hypothetical protein
MADMAGLLSCCALLLCLQAGIGQLPKDPFMVILYSSFLMDVLSSYQSGYTQLQAAKKLDTNFLLKFAIFSREQQHIQRGSSGGLGNKAADLVRSTAMGAAICFMCAITSASAPSASLACIMLLDG